MFGNYLDLSDINSTENLSFGKMFPSKSRMDYMTEMNRLFPPTSENETLQASPFNQSTMANRSSSSADSTSPESLSDMSLPFAQRVHSRSDTSQSIFSTPIPNFNSPIPQDFEMKPINDYDMKPLSNFDMILLNDIEMRPIYSTPRPPRDTRLFYDHHKPRQDIHSPAENFMARRHPIVGRKIIANPDNFREFEPASKLAKYKEDINHSTPQQPEKPLMFSQCESPSNVNNYFIENNVFYELFPTETKEYEFKTRIKGSAKPNISQNPSNASSNMCSASPSMSNASPSMSNASPSMPIASPSMSYASPSMSYASPSMSNTSPNSLAPCSPILPNFSPNLPSPTQFYPKHPSIYGPSSSNQDIGSTKMCAFCRKNGETPMVYMTHSVKQRIGNKQIVTCPILRSHVCSTCGASGDYAHTITYCPVLRNNNQGQPLESTTITLKNTRIMSNGRRRY